MRDIELQFYDAFRLLAREFNEWVAPERAKAAAAAAPSEAKGDRPGDEYNRRGDWSGLLERHGWKVDHTSGDVTRWTRPGKGHGVSATTGKCKTDGGGDLLYVFSSNAAPFEADTAYSKFAAYALLEHGGDFEKAASDLRRQGYSRTDPTVVFPAAAPAGPGERPDDGVRPDFDFATNADLKKYDLGVNWVWEQWFQCATVNLLSAEGGAGKTRFVLDLCRRVHMGLEWPDGTPTVPWPHQYLAMWVAGDRNHGELLENSTRFGFGDRISYSGSKQDPLGGITLNSRDDFATLYRRVKAARPMFVVVDTAGGATSYNLVKQEEARDFFAPLSDMAVRLNVCVVVITHLNASKNTYGKRAEERVRTVIRITSEDRKPETKRRIEVQKSNALFPDPIGMTLGECGCTYDSEPPAAPVPFGQSAPAGDDSPEDGPKNSKVAKMVAWLEQRLAVAPVRVADALSHCDPSDSRNFGPYYGAVKKLRGRIVETTDSQNKKWIAFKDGPAPAETPTIRFGNGSTPGAA